MPKKISATRVSYDDFDGEFAIFPFGAFKASTISGDLVKFLGPLLGSITPLFAGGVDTSKAVKTLLKMDISDVMVMIRSACDVMDGETIERLLRELLTDNGNISVEYRGESGRVEKSTLTQDLADELFIGNLDTMLYLAVDVVKVNYSGFFTRLLARLGSQQETSTGKGSKNTGSSTPPVTLL